ncbi:MAG: glutamate--tRNA ligase [Buchnera aphidicola (Chaetogeoica yunlongensis)]
MIVKTRFAPSPTGPLHIGSIRTALYSWLYAKNKNGKFVLRIEDTDFKRSTSDFVVEIIDNLKWLGLNWDEGPYFQSKKLEYYKDIIGKMLKCGLAYKCYCTCDRLLRLRKRQILLGEKPKYDRKCRDLFKNNISNTDYSVRFCNPDVGYVSFNDAIRGKISIKNTELDDLIIQRANGLPTYNFCVTVDDRDMEITHVIRGDDHISNTPRQINILKALGAHIPIYAHVSMILSENKKKLSKRNTVVTSISEYRSKGYLPEALLNYIVRLGWSHGNQEIFCVEDMIRNFSFKSINNSACCLNEKKLLWLNRFYIKNLSENVIKKHLESFLITNKINYSNKLNLFKLVKLIGSRCDNLQDIVDNSSYFYEDYISYDQKIFNKYLTDSSRIILQEMYDAFLKIKIWNVIEIRIVIDNIITELKESFNNVAMFMRVVITGKIASPNIIDVIYYIGKSKVLLRFKLAIEYIDKNKG